MAGEIYSGDYRRAYTDWFSVSAEWIERPPIPLHFFLARDGY